MSGRKAGVNMTANIDTNIYSPGGSTLGTYFLSIANRNASGSVRVRAGLSATFGTLDWNTDTLQPDTSLNAGAVLEIGPIVAAGANAIVGHADGTGCTFLLTGVEQ